MTDTKPSDVALEALKARLRVTQFKEDGPNGVWRVLRNPDGPKAVEALELLEAKNAEKDARIAALELDMGQIAGKNDLSGVPDDDIESAARNALYECELIARAALKESAS